MADFSTIIQEINDDINTNGVGAITGAKLNEVLRDMIAAVNAAKTDILPDGALYGGFVRPDEPPTYGDDYRYYYLAEENGEYIYFNRWYVDSNVSMFYYDTESEVWRQKVLWIKNVVLDGMLQYKAGKPVSSTQGHIPNLDRYGDLEDSGIAASDVATTSDLAGKQDVISDLATIRSGAAAGATAYQKPSGGIPKTDLASGVQTSLGKADTAFQKPSGGIPESDLSSDVQQALQKHFKGWYVSSSALPANPVVGDYAYVKGATSTDPAAIYECTTAGTWSDSGRTADTSNVQTFASGEEVNEVHIVNDLTTGGVHDVLSAEQGKTLNTQISQIGQDVNDLLTHNMEITPLPITLNLDHFYNGFGLEVGSTFTDGANAAEGIACVSVNVAEGEKYHIKGKGNAYAYKQYWLVDSANKVTRITSESSIDIEITIQSGEAKLYCNFRNYDSLTEGLWFLEENWLDSKVNAMYQDDIKKDIDSPTIVEGYAYNNGDDPIGFIYTSNPTQYSGAAYCLVPIIQGIEVTLFGVGSPNAFRYYMFTDKNGAIIEKSSETINSRASGLKLTIPSNARLLWVNFTSYDSSTDRVEVKYSFGINSLYNDSKPFSGKNIVCFGDSLTEFREQFNRKMHYSDYIAEITGANVINVGIGGTRLSRRATPVAIPTNEIEAYAALDIVSLVEAVSNNDYSYATAAATYLDNNGSSGRMDIVQRLSAIEWAKIDAVTILGGSNDWFGGASIGVSGGNDKGTVFGAINEIVRMLLTAYPSIKLYWFTPTVRWIGTAPRTEENWGDNYAVNGKTLMEFSSALFGEVVNNHIPICDMYNTLGWTMYNFKEYFLDSDGTHPYKGFEPIGEKMVSFLNANRTF